MALSTISIRVDEETKRQFDHFCSDVGLNTSTAINMYLKAVLRERRIPFEIQQSDPIYSPASVAALLRGKAQLDAGRGQVHELLNPDDA